MPSANFKPIVSSVKEHGLLGFIAYKAGMATALVKDATPKVMSAGKQIAIPVTILEVPAMKLFSIRFYNQGKPIKEVIVSNDKELKKIVRVPKTLKPIEQQIPKHYDDIRVLVYSLPKQTSVKKTPDIIELAVNSDNKLEFVKSLMGKEITLESFSKTKIVDVRGVTKGKGNQGPLQRFGLKLKFHKSEKGRRRPGSIGPWHPAHVTFRAPMAGQMGLHTRVIYNLHVLTHGKISEKDINPKSGFPHYGKINSSYMIVNGSVQGPAKRQVLITSPFRPSKAQSKRKLEFMEVLTK